MTEQQEHEECKEKPVATESCLEDHVHISGKLRLGTHQLQKSCDPCHLDHPVQFGDSDEFEEIIGRTERQELQRYA